MTRSLSCLSFLFLVVLLCQPHVAVAQSPDADRFKHFVNDLKLRAGLLYPATVSNASLPKLKMEMVHWLSPRIVEAILERPGCLFVEELTVPRGQNKKLDIKGAMLFQPEGDVKRLIKRLASSLKSGDDRSEKVTLAGVEANRIEIKGSANPIVIGNLSGTCLIALGEKSFTDTVQRMKAGKTPTWLANMEEKVNIMRVAKESLGPQAMAAIDFLGVNDADSIELIGGLNKVNSSLHLLINTTDPEGVLDVLADRPVNEALLLEFPADSLFAGAVNADFDELLELLDTAMMMAGAPRGIGQQMFGAMENQLGIDVEDDLKGSTGETWGVFNGASDGVLTGTTFVGEAKDSEKLNNVLESFFQAAAEKSKETPAGYRPTFYEQDYNQAQIFSMRFPYLLTETAVCVKDNRFYVGLYPESVMAAIGDDSTRQPLLEQEQIARFKESVFLKEAQLISFAYADLKAIMQNAHPFALFMKEALQMRYGPLGRNQNLKALIGGMQFPPARTLIRHLDSAMGFVRSDKSGIEIEIRQTVPTNFAGVAVPVLVGGFLPAVGGARSAAQETQSLNNLRQIGLACLNYESANMKFPGNTTKKRDGESENRFSWRVHILPFIEQNNLYEQIRFDEPWDSEHNKTLMEQMPNVYKSPGSKAEVGMTVYRGFGEGGVLEGDDDQEVGFGNISDGSSNTILVQEVDEALATPWMKPECLEIEEAVLESIFGKHKARNVVLSDGSTHRIPSSVDTEKLKHLAQRADGNVVDINFGRNRRWGDLPEPDSRFVKPGRKKQY